MADTNEAPDTESGSETPAATPAAETKTETSKPAGGRNLKQRASFEDRMKRAAQASGSKEQAEPEDTATEDKSEAVEQEESKTQSEEFKGTADEKISAATKALEDGNIKELVKILGADKKLADVSNEKYRVLREKAKKNQEIENKLKAENNRLIELGRTMRAEFGEPRTAQQAYKAGKFGKAAEALQRWFGDDFATITKNIAKEIAGLSPEDKARLEEKRKFEEEKAAFEAEKKKTTVKQTEAQKTEAALKTIETKCAGHAVLKLKNASRLVLQRMEQAWDPDLNGFRITFKQAADEILQEKIEEAKALGLNVDGTPFKAKKEKPAPSPVATEAPKYDEKGRKMRKSFEQRMEEARRITERSRLSR